MTATGLYAVRWTETAEADLTAVVGYIAEDSVAAALEVFDRISLAAEALESFPERGRVVPELHQSGIVSYRELLPTPWRIIYRVEARTVYVLAVLDGRRDLEDLLLERIGRI